MVGSCPCLVESGVRQLRDKIQGNVPARWCCVRPLAFLNLLPLPGKHALVFYCHVSEDILRCQC